MMARNLIKNSINAHPPAEPVDVRFLRLVLFVKDVGQDMAVNSRELGLCLLEVFPGDLALFPKAAELFRFLFQPGKLTVDAA